MAIANADGSIVLNTKVDVSGINKGLQGIKRQTDGVTKSTKEYGEQAQKSGGTAQNAFAGVGKTLKKAAIAALAVIVVKATKEIVEFSREASAVATTAEASVQRLIDIYGSASKAVGDFIDANANALGMSRAAAASYASVYGNLFSVWADQATNAQLTNAYLNMTAVVASKTGRTVEDVQERIRSGLLGNTEAIEDLGVFVNVKTIEMTDAFQRMANGKSWEQLDAYTQQQIRTFAILEQATQKYGFEVAQTSALTKSQFQAAWQDFQATWGQVVNRILMPVLQVLTDILITSNAVMQSLFGVSSSTISQSQAIESAVNNQKELTKEIGKTEKAAKKAIAPFDDLQILSSGANGEESGEESAGSNIPSFALPEIGESGNLDALNSRLEKMNTLLEPIKASFLSLWETIKPNEADVLASFETLKTDVLEPFSLYISADLIPEFVGSFEKAFDSIFAFFGLMEEPFQDIWEQTVKPIFDKVGEWILEIIIQTGDSFSYISEKFSEYEEEINTMLSAIGLFFDITWSIVEPIISSVVEGIGNVLSTTIDVIFSIISIIGNAFGVIKNLFLAVVSLFKGDIDGMGEYLKLAGANFINIFVGIANAIISVINNVWSLIFDSIKGTVNAIGGLIDELASLTGIDLDLRWDAKAPLIPMIPKYVPALARGAVLPANKPFLSIVGDQKNGTNIEAPAELIKQMAREAIIEAGQMGQTTKEEHYYLGETELMSILYKLVRGGERLRGESLISGGVY